MIEPARGRARACWRSTCRASAPRRRSPPRSSRAPPTWRRRCTSAALELGHRAPPRRRQLARRLGRAGDGPGRLGRLGDRDLPRRPLARAARRAPRQPAPLGPAPAPARRAWRCAAAALRERCSPPSPPTPSASPPRPGASLVLGWIDASGYDGANRAMRTHVFDPAGYPETAGDPRLGRARPPGRPAAARAPARRRPLPRPARASATRRPGTTPSWSPRPCSRAASVSGRRLSSGRVPSAQPSIPGRRRA